jgi:putative addiction module CopG family antidote
MAKHIALTDLPEDLARFAEAQLSAGRFASVEDVLRAGTRALELEQRNEQKLAALRAAIADGDVSADADPGVFARIRAKHGLPASR